MPSPVLIFLHGPRAGERVGLDQDEFTLGRRDSNDIVLDDALVSRVHTIVMRRGGIFLIEDLGSHNGTYVNDERLHGLRQLHHGDKITIGSSRAQYEDPSQAIEETTMVADPHAATGASFTQRQIQVLRLLSRGLSNKQIGERLYVSERTVKAYLSSVFEKLGVNKRAAAVTEALRLGLIDMPTEDDTWA